MIIDHCKINYIFHLLLIHSAQAKIPKLEREDLKNLGVAFSPYTKSYDEKIKDYHPWNYTYKEVRIMTELVESRFSIISTYSTGYADKYANASWYETDANALIPRTAAYLNKGENKLILKVIQGIYQNDNKEVEDIEIENAFKIAEDANSIYPGTVTGINFFNLYKLEDEIVQDLINKIEMSRERAKRLNLKIGTRLHPCKDILGGPNQNYTKEIIAKTDFVFCNIFPTPQILQLNDVEFAVQNLTQTFLAYKKAIEAENRGIEVYLGEVGWPSRGKSHNSLDEKPNTITNMVAFWNKLAVWSKKENVTVIMFEAFDEPWKVNLNNFDKTNHGGRCGGEQHYGWWKRVNNKIDSQYIEKIYDPKEFFPDDDCVENKPNENKGTIIIIAVFVILLGVFIMGAFVFKLIERIKKTKIEIKQLTEAEIDEFLNGMSKTNAEHLQEAALQYPYNNKFEIPKSKITIDNSRILGSGEFGIVYKADMLGGKSVAVKTIKQNNVQAIRNLLSEIKLMSFIGNHPNVVSLVGACTEDIRKGSVFLAVELCELGSMQNYLREKKNKVKNVYENENENGNNYENFNIGKMKETEKTSVHYQNMIISQFQLYKWALEIASGMEFLEEKKVIHADLATRNVLLTSSLEAKITDFGLSRRLYEYQEYVKKNSEPLPWRWMAIESLDKMKFSHKSDVWAFGITLWEIFAFGDIPYPGLNWDIGFINQLENGLRMQPPKNTKPEIYGLMVVCWNLDPNQRPTFNNLKNSLSLLYNQENILI